MPQITVNGVRLYYEEAGQGPALLFLHEFAGDYRSWAPQVRFFSRRYRCIVYSARGYEPSEVPAEPARYSQANAVGDALGVLEALGIEKAHLCGLSMGSFTTLFFGLAHPDRVRSLTVAGGGYGAGGNRQAFAKIMEAQAARLLHEGMERGGAEYAEGPARVQLRNKDPQGFSEFRAQFLAHNALGAANTLRGIQCQRPDLFTLETELKACDLPTLIMLGDEDAPGMQGSLFLKRCLRRSGLVVFPRSGHVINLEEPALFNQHLLDFLTAVDGGAWGERDPKALAEL